MAAAEREKIRRKGRETRRMGSRTGERENIGIEDYDALDLPATIGSSLNSH